MKRLLPTVFSLALLALGMGSAHADVRPEIRLYRLDCGTLHLNDLSVLSDAGMYKGRTFDVVVSCYLIKHGDTWMLWDAGLSRAYLKGVKKGVLDMKLTTTIPEQLRAIGLDTKSINLVGISHAHFDHTGQVDDFPDATLVMQKAEYDVLSQVDVAEAHLIEPKLLTGHTSKPDHLKIVQGDYDFFGDGTIKAIFLPGHTPGHMALTIQLKNAGPVILSGDQWQFEENRRNNQVPKGNFSHDETIESSAKLESIVKKTGARLILEHDPEDNRTLPVFPKYLD
jgi:glyoxylase-like metal-dependent hydrolase (beta-lactamase superfamily II)